MHAISTVRAKLAGVHMPPMSPFTFLVMFCLLSSFLVHGSSDQMATIEASDNKDIVPETCKLCAHNDPNVNYTFCVETLGSVPGSHRADREGVAVIALKLAKSNARDVKSKVRRLLKIKPLSAYTKSCLETCRELYSDATSGLKDSVEAVESGRYGDANVWISSAVDAPGECEEGFEEGQGTGTSSPLTKENDEFFERAVLALAITALLG